MNIARYLIISLALAIPSVAVAQNTPPKTPPPQATETVKQSEVKGYLLPIVAGIRSAELSAAALHELAATEPLERRDARKTAELAEQAVKIAHERAEALRGVKGLSTEMRTQADTASKKLKDARASVERIQRQVGVIEGPFRKNEAQAVHSEAMKLHSDLADAQKAIQRVADTYQVSIKLEIPERAAMR